MGRGWYSYVSPAKSIKRGGRGGGRGGGSNGGRRGFRGGDQAAAAAAGCMGTLLHLFDFHHFPFCLNHQQQHDFGSSLYSDEQDQPSSLKGVEAPRNSLEVEDMFGRAASLAAIREEIGEDTSIPMGFAMMTRTRRDVKLRVQVPSSSRMGRVRGDEACSSESSSSPGPRTPNLVARLMGLEPLPDGASTPNNTTPRSSSSSSSQTHHLRRLSRHQSSSSGSRSSAPARNSDVDGHHRLSLQITKENRSVVGDVELPRHSCSAISTTKKGMWRDGFDENRSPGHYDRQVVKQAKENVLGKKFGLDITNRNEKNEPKRDEQLISLKTKKPQNRTSRVQSESNPSETSTPSRSPRLRRVESNNKEAETPNAKDINHQHKPQSPLPSESRFQSTLSVQARREPRSYREGNVSSRANQLRPKKAMDSVAKKKDELFVRRASGDRRRRGDKTWKEWKRPLLSSSSSSSSDVVPATVSGFLQPLKKLEYSSPTSAADDHVPPHQQLKKEQQQPHLKVKVAAAARADEPLKTTAAAATATTQLSTYSSCNNYGTIPTAAATVATSTTDARTDFKYITRILNHIGIDRNAPMCVTKWFSVTRPLNPSVFHDLEALYFSKDVGDRDDSSDRHVGLRCNRRLLFDLLDQILMDVMKPPYANIVQKDNRARRRFVHGSQLVEMMWRRIRSLPSTKCQVLEDIDTSLVERDLPNWERVAFQDEVESIALEIERDIMNSVVRDIRS